MIRIAVVDDEKDVLEYLHKKLLSVFETLNYTVKIEIYTNGKDVISAHIKNNFNIIFLDLDMPDFDGMETAKNIRINFPDVVLAIITNRDDLVFDTFQYDVSAFIRKKYIDNEIKTASERVYKKAVQKIKSHIFKTTKGDVCLNISDIMYIESMNHDIYLHDINNNELKVLSTLEKLEESLPEDIFVRCHSGYLVNCIHIFSLDGEKLELVDHTILPISRRRLKNVKTKFQCFMRCI